MTPEGGTGTLRGVKDGVGSDRLGQRVRESLRPDNDRVRWSLGRKNFVEVGQRRVRGEEVALTSKPFIGRNVKFRTLRGTSSDSP